ncbi:unnamed protein product [marine sediment metagenome]|uniref:Uncharacterized protein n=1 Tax=marine sediment metagenome TaxID=412755 RepID=X1A3K1_9ZZZZ
MELSSLWIRFKKNYSKNIQSWNELTNLFDGELLDKVIVVTFNKWDTIETERIDSYKFLEDINFKTYPKLCQARSIAIDGKGILSAFQNLVTSIFPEISFP